MKRVNSTRELPLGCLNTKKFEKAEFVGRTEQMTETAESGLSSPSLYAKTASANLPDPENFWELKPKK